MRRAKRVSVGTVLRVPFATVHDWPAGLRGHVRQGSTDTRASANADFRVTRQN